MWEDSLTVFCGIDWAERHHDVAIVDDTGTLLAKARITDDVAGYNKLLDLLSPYNEVSTELLHTGPCSSEVL